MNYDKEMRRTKRINYIVLITYPYPKSFSYDTLSNSLL